MINTFIGISGKQMTSVFFLLAVLVISLSLGSLTFLINNNVASLPEMGLDSDNRLSEGMSKNEQKKMNGNMIDFIKNTKNIPIHSKNPINL